MARFCSCAKWLLLAAALLLPGRGRAQSPVLVDSLTRQLRQAPTDSMRVKSQIRLGLA